MFRNPKKKKKTTSNKKSCAGQPDTSKKSPNRHVLVPVLVEEQVRLAAADGDGERRVVQHGAGVAAGQAPAGLGVQLRGAPVPRLVAPRRRAQRRPHPTWAGCVM